MGVSRSTWCLFGLLWVGGCAEPELVIQNTPPSVAILSPANGEVMLRGALTTWSARVSDAGTPTEELVVTWWLDDELLEGSPRSEDGVAYLETTTPAEAGPHILLVEVVDEGEGRAAGEVEFETVANSPPAVEFLSPLAEQVFGVGIPIEVTVSVHDQDQEDGAGIVLHWSEGSSDFSAAPRGVDSMGEASAVLIDSVVGARVITVSATDVWGETGEESLFFSRVGGDLDGDSYIDVLLGGDDCDDSSASVNPGAVEQCDEVDNDCDGAIDESDAEDARVWYPDTDADGFGDGGAYLRSCGLQFGYVEQAGDCNDGDGLVFPGADERCNGVDDDCDTLLDEDAIDALSWYFDLDLDGFGDASTLLEACVAPGQYVDVAEDCAPTLGSVHPAAQELCNDGLDNNCDGVEDVGAADAAFWYADEDGDGYGDPSLWVRECSQPIGRIANGLDCDDLDANISPSGIEVCNTKDDDCDGLVDEADSMDALTWYLDADGDSFGNPLIEQPACAAPMSYVDNPLDCDDTTEDAQPGGAEVCGDGLDNDCDGTTNGCELEGVLNCTANADAVYYGELHQGVVGATIAVGDIDGDPQHTPDYIVGAKEVPTGGNATGGAYLVYGPLTGVDQQADVLIHGEELWEFPANSIAVGSDLDADGIQDFALGSPSHGSDRGFVYVFRGGRTLASTVAVSEADAIIKSTTPGHRVGSSITFAEDFDGDGASEVVVGATEWHGNGAATGAVFLFPYAALSIDTNLAAADYQFIGARPADRAGGSNLTLADFSGDGYADLAIGVPGERSVGLDAGAVYIVYGQSAPPPTRTLADADFVLYGIAAGDRAGTGLGRMGDADGDGTTDLLVGAPYADGANQSGEAYLILGGGRSGNLSLGGADTTFLGEPGDRLGQHLDGGDVDGDGFQDALLSLAGRDAMVLFPGPFDGTLRPAVESMAELRFVGTLGRDGLLHDVDGDSIEDVVLGAGSASAPDGKLTGSACVFYGGAK